MKKILLISHDASCTGAPMLLLNLSEVLIKNSITVEFLLKSGGPLENKFNLKGKTYLTQQTFPKTLFQRLLSKLFKIRKPKFMIEDLPWQTYDYILSNTITNGDILPLIRMKYSGPIFSYIHELKMATSYATNPYLLNQLIKTSNWFFVPSIAVKKHLIENLNIQQEKIDILQYFIPIQSCEKYNSKKDDKREFIVGGIGNAEWRKGSDLFIQTALIVSQELPDANIKFIWKGVRDNGIELEKLQYDIDKAELNGKVLLQNSSENINLFYESIDVLFLSSREDPYPLVVLEAADFNIPTICFKNAGGAQEFIEKSEGGVTVNYLDLNEVAKNIIFYYYEEYRKIETGVKAKALLSATHQNEEYIFKQFKEAISNATKSKIHKLL